MKKVFAFITTYILLLALCIGAQAAELPDCGGFRALEFIPQDGFHTVLTDIYGEEHTFDGVLNIRTLEGHDCVAKIAEYAIFSGEEVVLSAQLHDIVAQGAAEQSQDDYGSAEKEPQNGYYSIKFNYNSSREVFLTGLTANRLDEMQS